jgi:hypothetical protein
MSPVEREKSVDVINVVVELEPASQAPVVWLEVGSRVTHYGKFSVVRIALISLRMQTRQKPKPAKSVTSKVPRRDEWPVSDHPCAHAASHATSVLLSIVLTCIAVGLVIQTVQRPDPQLAKQGC